MGSLLGRALSDRRARAGLLSALLLALVALILYKPPSPVRGSVEVDYGKLPGLFVSAVSHLNKSSSLAGRALVAEVNAAELVTEAEGVVRELVRMRRGLELEPQSDLVERLARASASYARVANASAKAYKLAELLSGSRAHIDRFLSAAVSCDAQAMAEVGRALKPNLTAAIALLSSSLADLAAVREEDLASDSHRKALQGAFERLARTLRALLQLLSAAEVSSTRPEEIARLCQAKREGRPTDNVSEGAVAALQSLKPEEAGPYSYPLSRLKALVDWALRGQGQGRQDQDQPGGLGAGYGAPETDD